MHLQSFSLEQVSEFNTKVSDHRESFQKFSFMPLVAGQVTNMRSNEDLDIKLSQQISNLGSCYKKDTFIGLLRHFSGNEEGGWDAKTRIPILSLEELSEGKIDR